MSTNDNAVIYFLRSIKRLSTHRLGRIADQISDDILRYILDNGFELAPENSTGQMLNDGREVFTVARRKIVLSKDIYDNNIKDAMERARQTKLALDAPARTVAKPATEQPEISEGIAGVACPQMTEGKPCGGALNRRSVCPSCVTGRMGYKYRYTCERCGCDIVTREELR